MADVATTSRDPRMGSGKLVLTDYIAAAATAGTAKREWSMPFACRLTALIVAFEGAGVGAGSTILDFNKNGTTIFTTQANRPTIATADTGMAAQAAPPEDTIFSPGDVFSYDVDAIPATTGHTRMTVTAVFGPR